MPIEPVCMPCHIGHHSHCEMSSDSYCRDPADGEANIDEILACRQCDEAREYLEESEDSEDDY